MISELTSLTRIDCKYYTVFEGSRPNGRDAQGRTPLQLLLENEVVWGRTFGDVVDTILSYGARIDEVTDGLTDWLND